MDYSEETDPTSSAFRPSSVFRAPTTEIPIIYFTTHGSFNVHTKHDEIEISDDCLGLATPFPEDMTILKFNFVPINVCNYGGSGVIGPKNVADYIHRVISMQLRPEIIMARYGFEYFLRGDPETTAMISSSGLSDSLENYKRSEFIDVPEQFYEVLYDVAILKGLRQETILDDIMSELNDCEVNDTSTSDSKLTEIEKENIMRGENVMRGNSMMMKIIDECVKKPSKDVKKELELTLKEYNRQLEGLRIKDLYPRLTGTALDHTSQKPIINIFNENPEVKYLMERINNATAYINHVDDFVKSNNWSISIPNKSGEFRRILNKTFSLNSSNITNGLDWNIAMFKPKTGSVEDIFTEIKPQNKIPGTFRTLTLLEILMNLRRNGMKTVILLDQTCSVFNEIPPIGPQRDAKPIMERKWTYDIKRCLRNGDTIYGGKRKKNQKTKNPKKQKTKLQKKTQKTQKNTKKYKKYTNI